MKSINLTPTWEEILPALIEIAANAETQEGRATGKAELLKIARYADEMPARFKALEEQAQSAHALRNALCGAIDALMHQVNQMRGMFDDQDGTIQAALDEGENALAQARNNHGQQLTENPEA